MPGGHVKPWIVSQCAAPAFDLFGDEVTAIAQRLSSTSQSLADEMSMPVHSWDESERAHLDAEVVRPSRHALYGSTVKEYETCVGPLRGPQEDGRA